MNETPLSRLMSRSRKVSHTDQENQLFKQRTLEPKLVGIELCREVQGARKSTRFYLPADAANLAQVSFCRKPAFGLMLNFGKATSRLADVFLMQILKFGFVNV